MLAGAILAWAVLAPALVSAGIATADYSSLVSWLLWPAVTMMVTSGLVGLLRRWRLFARAVTDLGQFGDPAPALLGRPPLHRGGGGVAVLAGVPRAPALGLATLVARWC